MSRYTLVVGLTALAFAAGPAFAQSTPPAPAPAPTPAQGTVKPHHVMHPAPAHKMPKMTKVSPDMSADQLNAKELASIQHGMPASTPAAPMPATKTP
jgi:hypothetical protein